MGTVLNAHCECGYSARASCASSRREHGRVFNYPHQCDQCHQVVTADLLQSPPRCPECGNQGVTRYGVAIRHPKYGWFYRLMTRINGSAQKQRLASAALNASSVDSSYCYNLGTTFGITREAYRCPQCGEARLRFSAGLMYD